MFDQASFVEGFKILNPSAGPTELKDAAAVGRQMEDWEADNYHDLGPGGMDDQQRHDLESRCWANIRKARKARGESEEYEDSLNVAEEAGSRAEPYEIDPFLHTGASAWRKPVPKKEPEQ